MNCQTVSNAQTTKLLGTFWGGGRVPGKEDAAKLGDEMMMMMFLGDKINTSWR